MFIEVVRSAGPNGYFISKEAIIDFIGIDSGLVPDLAIGLASMRRGTLLYHATWQH